MGFLEGAKKLVVSNFGPNKLPFMPGSVFKRTRKYLRQAFYVTFPFQSLVPSDKKMQHKGWFAVLNFLGFPIPFEGHDSRESLPGRIWRSFSGWHQDSSPKYQKMLNYTLIKPLFLLIWNLAAIPLKAVWNLLTLAVEYLPYAIKLTCNIIVDALSKIRDDENSSTGMQILAAAGVVFFSLLYMVINLWHGLARCVTSPAQAALIAGQQGKQLGGWAGLVVGGLLIAGSMAVSVTIYSFLFPLFIHAIIGYAPAVVAELTLKALIWIEKISGLLHSGVFLAITTVPLLTAFKLGLDTLSTWWNNQVEGDLDKNTLSDPSGEAAMIQLQGSPYSKAELQTSAVSKPAFDKKGGFEVYPTTSQFPEEDPSPESLAGITFWKFDENTPHICLDSIVNAGHSFSRDL